MFLCPFPGIHLKDASRVAGLRVSAALLGTTQGAHQRVDLVGIQPDTLLHVPPDSLPKAQVTNKDLAPTIRVFSDEHINAAIG